MNIAEHYWLKYDISHSTLHVVTSRENEMVCQLGIDHYTDGKGNAVFDFGLLEGDAEKIIDEIGSTLEIPNIFQNTPTNHNGNEQILTLNSYDYTIATSLRFRKWASRQSEKTRIETQEVLASAYHRLNPSIDLPDIDGCVDVNISGNFRLETIGNCACLSYLGSDIDRLDKDDFIPLDYHNVDDPRQLLSLLAAVAFLWGRAREDLNGSLTTTPPSP